jgi:hypothetical protein
MTARQDGTLPRAGSPSSAHAAFVTPLLPLLVRGHPRGTWAGPRVRRPRPRAFVRERAPSLGIAAQPLWTTSSRTPRPTRALLHSQAIASPTAVPTGYRRSSEASTRRPTTSALAHGRGRKRRSSAGRSGRRPRCRRSDRPIVAGTLANAIVRRAGLSRPGGLQFLCKRRLVKRPVRHATLMAGSHPSVRPRIACRIIWNVDRPDRLPSVNVSERRG